MTKEDKARLKSRGRNKKDRRSRSRGNEDKIGQQYEVQDQLLQPELEERLTEDQVLFKEQLGFMEQVLKRSTPETKHSIGS